MTFKCDTYCGLYCGACDVFIANKEGTVEERALEWDMAPEDLRCHGCKTETTAVYCKDCDIRQCAENNNSAFCFECGDYPCTRLTEFKNDEWPHHSVVVKNLETIKKKGVQEWLKEQESRWSCPECGTPFAWYDKICKTCSTTVLNCKDEEKEL